MLIPFITHTTYYGRRAWEVVQAAPRTSLVWIVRASTRTTQIISHLWQTQRLWENQIKPKATALRDKVKSVYSEQTKRITPTAIMTGGLSVSIAAGGGVLKALGSDGWALAVVGSMGVALCPVFWTIKRVHHIHLQGAGQLLQTMKDTVREMIQAPNLNCRNINRDLATISREHTELQPEVEKIEKKVETLKVSARQPHSYQKRKCLEHVAELRTAVESLKEDEIKGIIDPTSNPPKDLVKDLEDELKKIWTDTQNNEEIENKLGALLEALASFVRQSPEIRKVLRKLNTVLRKIQETGTQPYFKMVQAETIRVIRDAQKKAEYDAICASEDELDPLDDELWYQKKKCLEYHIPVLRKAVQSLKQDEVKEIIDPTSNPPKDLVKDLEDEMKKVWTDTQNNGEIRNKLQALTPFANKSPRISKTLGKLNTMLEKIEKTSAKSNVKAIKPGKIRVTRDILSESDDEIYSSSARKSKRKGKQPLNPRFEISPVKTDPSA